MDRLRKKRYLLLLFTDVLLINLSYLLAFICKYSYALTSRKMQNYLMTFLVITFIYIIAFYVFSLYKSLWEYASTDEFIKAVSGCLTGNLMTFLFGIVAGYRLPGVVYTLAGIFTIIFVVGFRVSFRVYRRLSFNFINRNRTDYRRVMVIGAGQAGRMIINEMRLHCEMRYNPVVVIDDNPLKIGRKMVGLPIIGGRDAILTAAQDYRIDVIAIAIPSMDNKTKEEIINICKETDCKLKIVPSVYDFLDRRSPLRKMRNVEVDDLLGRDPIVLDMEGIAGYLKNKVVIVTGGGGSIGSELSRQIAKFEPKKLIILDIYENNTYDIQNELVYHYPNLDIEIIIASVRDRIRIDNIFKEYRPEVVFHAAAHKHVPLMEHNPNEAIKNNVFGTLNVAECASMYRVSRFVLISTDKAVNPTNVMGASKRICEMIIQSLDKISKTEFVAVRFGNVLGSNGSVIPLFKKQIAAGGPVTLTHREITRFFMTIPEASQLVLQAGAYAKGGEIFVLDMGKPVKIYDLAYDLIRLSGLDPGIDIEVVCTGLRPGEKLYEEVLMDEEELYATKNSKIFIGKPLYIEFDELKDNLNNLNRILDISTKYELLKAISQIVPTYRCKYLEEMEGTTVDLMKQLSGDNSLRVNHIGA